MRRIDTSERLATSRTRLCANPRESTLQFLRGDLKNGSAPIADAIMAGLEIISITDTAASVCGAISVNLVHVKTLTKTGPTSMNKLMAVAKKGTKPNAVALPTNWANYSAIMKGFTKRCGIRINSADLKKPKRPRPLSCDPSSLERYST